MFRALLAASFFAISFSAIEAQPSDNALRCKDHPAYTSDLNPVLVSSWDYDVSSSTSSQLVYIPRYTGHVYEPDNEPGSTKYKGLDLFHTADTVRGPNFQMTFQRGAIAYMFVNVEDDQFDASKTLSLGGEWKPEGWATRVVGKGEITYGVHVNEDRKMTQYAYVFSKTTGTRDYIDFPQARFVKSKIVGVEVPGSFNLWIAEADGSPSPPVGNFQGAPITANEQCPDALHDVWKVPDTNPDDIHTQGALFSTWHPAWDPCFWCAYDHEHGSSPVMLMDYKPKFTYTSWKNDDQMESDRGFKGYVISSGLYYMYFSLHIVQSELRRVSARHHTINFAVVDRKTKELLMDIQHKGDFGWTGVRLSGGKNFTAIDETQEEIKNAQANGPNNFKSINVIDEDNPNPEFEFTRAQLLIGQYEVWQTLPMCMQSAKRDPLFQTLYKLPSTGIKSLEEPNTIVRLGKKQKGKFFKSVGMNRSLRFNGLQVGAEHCPGTGAQGGFFYTDQYGKEVQNGPGINNVRQFVKPGLKFTLSGRFEAEDIWTGLHFKGARGFFSDHGHGINPDRN